MGWTEIYREKPDTVSVRASVMRELFNEDGFTHPTKVLKHRMIGTTWYALVETQQEDGSSYKWFVICLTEWSKKDGILRYKMMDNSCGPYYYDCPISWFKGVPVYNEHDREWRDGCIAKQAKKQEETKKSKTMSSLMKENAVATFSVEYCGEKEWLCTNVKGVFKDRKTGCKYKLRGWKKYLVSITEA